MHYPISLIEFARMKILGFKREHLVDPNKISLRIKDFFGLAFFKPGSTRGSPTHTISGGCFEISEDVEIAVEGV